MRRIGYRIGQFFRALRDVPDPAGLHRAQDLLSPALFDLFLRLPQFEQAHALRTFVRLTEQGITQPDLLTAALLHDVGKAKVRLRPWDRAIGVLVKKFLPLRAQQWGRGAPGGLRTGIVVAQQHPRWGGEMVRSAGATQTVVRLIAAHQDPNPPHLSDDELVLLRILQSVDDVS